MQVSIVITTYNLRAYAGQAIASALAQEAVRELIVVDDGSTDGTIDVLEALAAVEPRVRLVLQSNAGSSSARNAGAELALGDQLLFLDGDDCLLPGAVAALLPPLLADPQAACCYGQWRAMRDDGTLLPPNMKLRSSYGGFVLKEIVKRGFLLPGCVLLNRAAFVRSGGFDRLLHYAEDWEFFCRLSLEGRFLPIRGDVMGYRLRQSSKSAASNTRRVEMALEGVERVFSNPRIQERLTAREWRSLRRQSRASAILGVSTRSFWEGDRMGSLRASWLAIRQCPSWMPRVLARYGLNVYLLVFARARSPDLP